MTRIPPFNGNDVLPGFVKFPHPTEFACRSPYLVTSKAVVDRFGTSMERIEILRGWLTLRADLAALGLRDGFQWIDGSFVENIEESEGRAPGDIDVATFTTERFSQDVENRLFYPPETKKTHRCDSYQIWLGDPPDVLVELASYWQGPLVSG